MPLAKLIAASLLIPIGLVFLLAIATELSNPNATKESKLGMTVGGLILGVPTLILGSGLIWHALKQEDWQRQQRRHHSIFLRLLRENQGYITVADFVRYTQLSDAEAKRFLDEKALRFEARVGRQPDGESLYHFPM
ncbi:MAG: hypothetical protein ACRC8A_16105 [Microcoleaceae cyanobacterium]